MSQRKHLFIIYNPVAGRRRKRLLLRVIRQLRQSGAFVRVRKTRQRGEAMSLSRVAAAIPGMEIVVAAGGDGTINEVASGLLGTGVPLGIIPLGTANVLAIEMGILRRADGITSTLLHAPAREIVTAACNNKLFLLWTGVGFDSLIVDSILPAAKRRFGKLAFVLSGLRVWLQNPNPILSASTKTEIIPARWIIVTNARYYAGHYLLCRSAELANRKLHVILFPPGSRLTLTRHLLALALGRLHKQRDVTFLTPDTVTISGPSDLPVQIDGDIDGRLPLYIENRGLPLRIVGMRRP